MLKEKEVKQKQQTRLNRLDNPNEIEDDDHRHLVDQFGHFLRKFASCTSMY